jgi:hypothetical protein
LAQKNHGMAESLNANTINIQAIHGAMGKVEYQASHVETQVSNLSKNAVNAIKDITKKITAIEEACALTVTTL